MEEKMRAETPTTILASAMRWADLPGEWHDLFHQQQRRIRSLERENRRLRDGLNRLKNLAPGRRRIYRIGRIAAALEHEADQMIDAGTPTPLSDSDGWPEHVDYLALKSDVQFLSRLEWDLEQLRDATRGGAERARPEWERP